MRILAALFVLVLACRFVVAQSLTPVERAGGWVELSGDQAARSWRLLGEDGFPSKVWVIEDGAIRCLGDLRIGGGWDLVSVGEFGDFELTLEFQVAQGTNSGIKYRVKEIAGATAAFGPEFQVLDDAGTNTKSNDIHSSGGLYDVIPPAEGKVLHPAGEWNHVRILVRDNVTQHWLNGVKVVECRIGGEEWIKHVGASKFKDSKDYGLHRRGRIALQDHGGVVTYRNIKARDLDAALPNEVTLFDGSSLSAFAAHLNDGGKLEDVWSIVDDTLVCKGRPIGYIRTTQDFTNYVLKLEWRFNPITKAAGNSGVLLRVIGEDKVWPKSVEAQLQSENAGDFWNIEEFAMKTDASRLNGRNTKKTHGAERPVGEWNEYEIIVNNDKVTLKVNGEVLNEAWDVAEVPGKIGFQSEGAEIHFRRIRLSPIVALP